MSSCFACRIVVLLFTLMELCKVHLISTWSQYSNYINPHPKVWLCKNIKVKLTTAEHWGNNQSWGHSSNRKILSGTSVTARDRIIRVIINVNHSKKHETKTILRKYQWQTLKILPLWKESQNHLQKKFPKPVTQLTNKHEDLPQREKKKEKKIHWHTK